MKLSAVVALLFLPVVNADLASVVAELEAKLPAYEPAPKEELGFFAGVAKALNDVRTCGCGGCKCSAEGGLAFQDFAELYRAIREVERLDDPNDPSADVYLTYGCPMLIWDVSKVTDMSGLFFGYQGGDFGNLDNWNVSAVTDMSSMFLGSNFNGGLNGWDTSKVTDMSNMFAASGDLLGDVAFNQPLFNWDTTKVINMQGMFSGNQEFNSPLVGASAGTVKWNTAAVINMKEMFQNAVSFNQDVSGFDVSSLDDATNMFRGASSFNQDLCSWRAKFGADDDDGESTSGEMFKGTRCITFESPVDNENAFCAACVTPAPTSAP